MTEWLQSPPVSPDLDGTTMAWRLLAAALFGLLVAGVYAATQRRATGSLFSLATTLVLLTILVAMTTIVIGDSVARAFGLVGALSIVRFRTVVDDTRDTSFVIFAVVVGMALGSGHYLVCCVGVPVVTVVAVGMSGLGRAVATSSVTRRLEVRVGLGHDPAILLEPALRPWLRSWSLVSIVSARQGAALNLVDQVRLKDAAMMLALVKSVHALEGVQAVELKEA